MVFPMAVSENGCGFRPSKTNSAVFHTPVSHFVWFNETGEFADSYTSHIWKGDDKLLYGNNLPSSK